MAWPMTPHRAVVGSGTTLVAAELNGRRWMGVDIDARALAIAAERLESEAGWKRPAAVSRTNEQQRDEAVHRNIQKQAMVIRP